MSASGKSGFGPQLTDSQKQAITSQSTMGPGTLLPEGSAAVVDPNAANPLGPAGQQPVTPQSPGGFGGGKGGFSGELAPVQQPQQSDIYSRVGGQQNVDSNSGLDGYQPPTSTPMQPTMPMQNSGMGGGKGMFAGPGQTITPEQLQNFASQLFKQ